MPDFPWYAVGQFDDLQQGDIFLDCPIIIPDLSLYQDLISPIPSAPDSGSGNSSRSLVEVVTADVIVMSQSCDLAKPDCSQVLVCTHHDAMHYSKDRRAEISRDRHVSLHMIEACDADIIFGQRVLDFRAVYTIPKEFLLAIAQRDTTRARLLPPYREQMAQAFARFFMRVGLPRNLRPS